MSKESNLTEAEELKDLDEFFEKEFLAPFSEQHFEELEQMEELLSTAPGEGEEALIDLESKIKSWLHTLKGDAGTVGLVGIEKVSHHLEDRVAEAEIETLVPEFFRFIDWLRDTINCLANDKPLNISAADYLSGDSSSEIASALVNDRARTTRVRVEKLDQLMELTGELIVASSILGNHCRSLSGADATTEKHIASLDALTTGLRDLSASFRLTPLEAVLKKMNRVVHEAASRTGKQVRLEINGAGVGLDKSIVERLPEPLMHLVRNSVTHGIEVPSVRESLGKPSEGVISISAEQEREKVTIKISDDGAGIDAKSVVARAKEKKLISEGVIPSEKEALELIFQPGFSTAEQVSDLSGRGVGMDIVREKLQEMRGSIVLDTELGKGTSFKLELPVSLALVEGAIVRVCEEKFIVPLENIEELVDLSHLGVENRADKAVYKRKQVPLTWLDECFENSSLKGSRDDDGVVIFTGKGSACRGFVANEVLGTCSTIVKGLEGQLFASSGVSGAAILADGSPCLIIDLNLVGKSY